MMAEQPDPLLAQKKELASDFRNASVREIALEDARNILIGHEYQERWVRASTHGAFSSASTLQAASVFHWLDGTQRGGKDQVFLTIGAVVGAIKLTDRLSLALGAGYQWAVAPQQQLKPGIHPNLQEQPDLFGAFAFLSPATLLCMEGSPANNVQDMTVVGTHRPTAFLAARPVTCKRGFMPGQSRERLLSRRLVPLPSRRLQLALEFVEKPPIRVFSDDPLRDGILCTPPPFAVTGPS